MSVCCKKLQWLLQLFKEKRIGSYIKENEISGSTIIDLYLA